MDNKAPQHVWHTMSKKDIFQALDTSPKGITQKEADIRHEKHGANSLPSQKTDKWHQLVLRQFSSPLVYVLLIVVVITFILGEVIDGAIIALVLVFNAVIGTYQEGKAQNAILALRSYERDSALVRRGGTEMMISATELVPGDVIIIMEGNRIPADARIIKVEDLSVDEAVLTGESKAKSKDIDIISDTAAVPGDQINMLFKGTFANRGQAEAVVVATGQQTQMGQLSSQVALYDTEIPLQTKIKKLTNALVIAVGVILFIIVIFAFAQGYEIREIFLTVASLLVAVMPEGLPIVVTLVLAQGVQRMAKNNVLVKRLQAVEALGNADVIAVDKTGTLTKNELSVTKVLLNNSEFSISGSGYDTHGDIQLVTSEHSKENAFKYFANFAKLSTLSANAEIFRTDEATTIAGDPTEAAMMVLGERAGLNKKLILQNNNLLDEIAFSYKKKYYANLHEQEGSNLLIVTGAPEVIIGYCSQIWQGESSKTFIASSKEQLSYRIQTESDLGHRVIALASKNITKTSIEAEDIFGLTFQGLFIMEDQIREEVADAMKSAQESNIKVVMITGDYPSTAQSIATDAGVFKPGDRVLSGMEIEQMSDSDLGKVLMTTTVFARVTPEHKLRIIQGFRELGKTIAMTGDGVNDVPSLVAADLGVAMGKIGTEAAKAAADIVLLDDNFGNIPKAVQEGKRIFQNIQKVVSFLLSTNSGEVLVIAYSIIAGLTIPLNPAQIIWINLLTDSFLVFPLTTEDSDTNSKKQSGQLLGVFGGLRILVVAGATLTAFLVLKNIYTESTPELLSTVTLLMMVFGQVWIALSLRNRKTIKGFFSNKWFWLAVLGVIILQIIGVYFEPIQNILRTTNVSRIDWTMAIGISLIIPFADMIFVYLYKLKNNISTFKRK